MEDFESYKFTQKKYKKLVNIVDYIYNLTPLVKYLKKLTDNLNCIFMEYPDKECINDLKLL